MWSLVAVCTLLVVSFRGGAASADNRFSASTAAQTATLPTKMMKDFKEAHGHNHTMLAAVLQRKHSWSFVHQDKRDAAVSEEWHAHFGNARRQMQETGDETGNEMCDDELASNARDAGPCTYSCDTLLQHYLPGKENRFSQAAQNI